MVNVDVNNLIICKYMHIITIKKLCFANMGIFGLLKVCTNSVSLQKMLL